MKTILWHILTTGWILCVAGIAVGGWFYLAARMCKLLAARWREGDGVRSAYLAFLTLCLMGLAIVAAFWLTAAWRLIEGFLRVRP